MGKWADEKRAKQFGLKLSQVGRVVWRGVAGTGGASCPVAPAQIFKNGFNWNYDGLKNPIVIQPKQGIVRGAISTSKHIRPAMHYSASIIGTDASKRGWVYAIYCKRGIDYVTDFINNPLLGQAPLPSGVRGGTKATLTVNEGALPTVNMTGVGANNLEIIMVNVDAHHVIAARPLMRVGDHYYLGGNVQVNPKSKLAKENATLQEAVVNVLADYDEIYDFADFSPDQKVG